MIPIRVAIISIVACIAAITAASAQDELPKQKVSFFAFDLPEGRSDVQLLIEKDIYVKLALPRANATRPMVVANPGGTITIYDKPVVGPDGQNAYPVLGRIKSSPEWKEVMVILIGEKKDGKDVFAGFAFPMSKKDLPMGCIKLANLSPYPVRGVLGSSKLMFRAGTIETIKLKEPPGKMINVIFQYQEKDVWKKMMATMWAVSDRDRTLIFAYKSPISGNMVSKSIPIRSD